MNCVINKKFILATIPECSRCEAMFRSIELYKAHRQVCCGGRVCFNDEIPANRKLERDDLLIFYVFSLFFLILSLG